MLVASLLLVLAFGTVLAATDRATRGGPEPAADGAASDEQLRWLVDSYGPLMYRVAFAITHDRLLAEDVVQDSLFQAWTSMPSWEGDVPVRWLRRVTRNRAISVMRKENRSRPEDEWDSHRQHGPDTHRVVEGRELMAAVQEALTHLDEQARTMIVLRETEDMSYEEIAAVVDLTPAVVKTRLYRARHALKQHLKDWDLQ